MGWLDRQARIGTREVLELGTQRVLDARALGQALTLAGRVPGAAQWPLAIERLLGGLAAVLAVTGIAFVVAANWAQWGPWMRFALAQGVVIVVVLAAAWRGLGTPLGKVLLTAAIALIGPLLALFGQTYQTGADTWELFQSWALLALPWTIAACYAPAWLLWLVLAEGAVAGWLGTFDLFLALWFGVLPTWIWAVLFNVAALAAWEWAGQRFEWMAGRFTPRLIAGFVLGLLTMLTVAAIWDLSPRREQGLGLGMLLWFVSMGAGYWAYRVRAVDLGMLSLGVLSATVVVLAAIGRALDLMHAGALALWLGAGVLILVSTLARDWLRRVGEEARR
jgi:uncharacterized membrane protein